MRRRHSEPVVLAIDIGTSSVRTALFDGNARRIPRSSAKVVYRVRHLAGHGAELNPQVLLRATRHCLRQTRGLAKPPVAVGGSGFWHGLLGLDRTGEPLTPIFPWADSRCVGDAARLREKFDEREIQLRTGCMLRASFWPAKLLWLRRTRPKFFRRVARWVSPAEWLFEQIFGVSECSHSMASGTGLYNLARRDWDEELIAACDLTRSRLNLLRDEVDADGLTVYPAIGDGAAGNLGSGASTRGVVAINVGTSAAVRAILSRAAPLPFGFFRFVVDQNRFVLGGAVSNAGNLRAWSLRELRLPNDQRALEKILSQPEATSAGLTILPFWVSERAPTWPERLDGVIHGLTQASTAADILRASIAAVCHRLADILTLLEDAVGQAKKIIVSGGILQSPASLQILADSLGHELHVCADQEASLCGAAIHVLEQSGRNVAAPKCTRRIRPKRGEIARAREQRERQRALEKLLGRWAR